MKKILIITLAVILLTFGNVSAGTDGENSLSKKNSRDVKDCFEKVNRGIFAFNQGLDSAFFEPLAKGYRKLPVPIRRGTGNVLDNLSTLMTIPNNLLQGEVKKAGQNTVRFAVNTTLGVLGIFDPASDLGFETLEKEDYGQTFGSWGIGEGCYLVLPILGPSTARDMIGLVGSTVAGGDPWYNVTVKNDTHYFTDFDYYGTRAATGIDFRAKNIESFENLEKNSMDFYASVRSLYLQDRKQKIENSKKVIDTMDDGDWEEIESN
jgi:phospholipid-binding lipoprotein MlaA